VAGGEAVTNPTPLDFATAQKRYRHNAEARRVNTNVYTDALEKKAEAEHSYRKALSVSFAQHRAKGEGVGEAEVHARAEAAHFALSRDMADAEAKGAAARLEQLKDERATLRHLADWAREES
jgi:hypothetical protein